MVVDSCRFLPISDSCGFEYRLRPLRHSAPIEHWGDITHALHSSSPTLSVNFVNVKSQKNMKLDAKFQYKSGCIRIPNSLRGQECRPRLLLFSLTLSVISRHLNSGSGSSRSKYYLATLIQDMKGVMEKEVAWNMCNIRARWFSWLVYIRIM